MKIEFIHAIEDDLPEIVRIYNQTILGRESTADLEPISISDRKEWFHKHKPENRPLWIMKLEEDIVGWISLSGFYGRIAYEKTVEISIYIDENYRGRNLGVEALNFVESNVELLGIETILAFIFGHNLASHNLFKKFAYTLWGHLPEVAEMDGIKRDLNILGKKYKY